MKFVNLQTLIHRAEYSSWSLWCLNVVCARIIPFNRPHGIKVRSIHAGATSVVLPYRRSNQNHLSGMHACAQATAAEFCAGMMLLFHVDPKAYRLIMREIKVEFKSQARSAVIARVELAPAAVHALVELSSVGALDIPMAIELFDKDEKLVSQATVLWQVKDWGKVRQSGLSH